MGICLYGRRIYQCSSPQDDDRWAVKAVVAVLLFIVAIPFLVGGPGPQFGTTNPSALGSPSVLGSSSGDTSTPSSPEQQPFASTHLRLVGRAATGPPLKCAAHSHPVSTIHRLSRKPSAIISSSPSARAAQTPPRCSPLPPRANSLQTSLSFMAILR